MAEEEEGSHSVGNGVEQSGRRDVVLQVSLRWSVYVKDPQLYVISCSSNRR